MRIQHNIMAMNAYRNYNLNNKALSGNLEKLSSGYKINRAGDDAAGLAISEKMRAQITGLNAAQKNVKDGISLVKTAEGAMQEIQDMLNRMDYLATQSANGTYQDEVDREALQKEVNQLNEEINRIAESANFNGIKLLDGTWDADAKVRGVNTAQKAVDAAQAALDEASKPVEVDPVYKDKTSAEIQKLMLPKSATNTVGDVGKATILETDGVPGVKPSFKLSLNGIEATINDPAGTGNYKAGFTITDSAGTAVKLEVTEADLVAGGYATKKGDKVSSADLAQAIVDKNNNALVTLDGIGYNVTADGNELVFTAAENPATEVNAHYSVTFNSAITSTNVAAEGISYTTGKLTVGTATTVDNVATITATIDGNEVVFKTAATTGNATAADWATAIGNATGTVDGKSVKLSKYFDVSAATSGTDTVLKFSDKDTSEAGSGNSISAVSIAGTGANAAELAADAPKKADAVPAYSTGVTGYSNFGTQDIKVNSQNKIDQLASTSISLGAVGIEDGMKIKLGDTEYTFAVGKDSKFKDAENVVDLTDMEAKDLSGAAMSSTVLATAVSRLTDVADSNEIFTVGQSGTDGSLTIKQKAEVKDSTDMSTMENFASYIGISTVDAAKTAEAQKAADAAQKDTIDAAKNKLAEAQKALDAAQDIEGGKALNLQIGDTSDSFNQLGVKIGSMKTTALGVDGLSVATSDDAAKAIDTIKNAINYVSSVRGDLGAYQNRLDHTANNLSVMAENIQDAESTIRDTDVAEEMMSYVKNNILVQSAQAMLAQANQVPQGVLQLLG